MGRRRRRGGEKRNGDGEERLPREDSNRSGRNRSTMAREREAVWVAEEIGRRDMKGRAVFEALGELWGGRLFSSTFLRYLGTGARLVRGRDSGASRGRLQRKKQ